MGWLDGMARCDGSMRWLDGIARCDGSMGCSMRCLMGWLDEISMDCSMRWLDAMARCDGSMDVTLPVACEYRHILRMHIEFDGPLRRS